MNAMKHRPLLLIYTACVATATLSIQVVQWIR